MRVKFAFGKWCCYANEARFARVEYIRFENMALANSTHETTSRLV